MTEAAAAAADDDDVIRDMAFALRYRETGRPAQTHANAASIAAATHILEMLKQSGYRFTKLPPTPKRPAPSMHHKAVEAGKG